MREITAPATRHVAQESSRGPGIFYGWWIAIAGCLIVFVGAGTGVYGPSVFLATLHDRNGWSRGVISLATTCYYLAGGLIGVFIGRWVDRHGPRTLFAVCAVVMSAGLILLGRATALWQIFPAYLLLAPGMAGLANIPISVLLTRWFVRGRAQALSIAMCGVSLGGMVLVPLTVAIVDRWSLGAATLVLAALVLAVVLPLTAFVIRRDPSEIGAGPDGDPPALATTSRPHGGTAARPIAPAEPVWTRSAAIRTRAFWVIVVAFMLGLGAQSGFLLHQLSYLGDEIGQTAAATVLSVTTGASIVGRLALGMVSDRLDKRWMAAACFAIQSAARLLILQTGSLPLIYLCMLAFGLTMGNSYILVSLLTAECFGVAAFGAVYGLLYMFVAAGSAFGPLLIGLLADSSGSYTLPFTLGGITALLSAVLVLGARRPLPATPGG